MGVTQIRFTDQEDGTMAIDATHEGDFDPTQMSHATLKAVSQFLPQILAPAGTVVHGDIGIRSAITDADRYQALRAMALMTEAQRDAIEALVEMDGCPASEAAYDMLSDKIVMIARCADVGATVN